MRCYSRTTLSAALFALSLSIVSVCQAESLFPDKALEAAVRKNVFSKRGTQEPLTADDVKDLSQVVAKGAGIRDLSGIEHCKRLMLLDLADNEISDLEILRRMFEPFPKNWQTLFYPGRRVKLKRTLYHGGYLPLSSEGEVITTTQNLIRPVKVEFDRLTLEISPNDISPI